MPTAGHGPQNMALCFPRVYICPMSPDAHTIIGTGIALAVLNVTLFAWLRGDVQEHGKQLAQLRERMAKLEGLLDGLREAVAGRR